MFVYLLLPFIKGKNHLCMLLVLFEQIRTKFESKHIYTDSTYWYNDDACKWLRLTQVSFTKQSQGYHGEVYSASQDMTGLF